MDRLQQAISRARQERAGSDPKPATRPTPAQAAAAVAASDAERLPASAGAWSDFKPLVIPEKTLQRNRLDGLHSGEAAIPYDMLRTKILQQARKNNWKRIALVSPESGSGKTTLAANLGFSFGRMRDRRTVVIDFDLRRMGLARLLGQTCQTSMADVLERRVSFAEHGLCHGGNVVFGLNSAREKNPSELLQNPVSAQVLAEIEETYQPDLVFFDTPPLMVSDDSQGLLQSVDCALLIVAAETTPMERIDVAERQLSELTSVMGIVLNKCRYTGGAHGYDAEYY